MPVFAAAHSQVALCDPRRGAVADRGDLFEARLRSLEMLIRLFETILLEE
jgi:hypothetical protein